MQAREFLLSVVVFSSACHSHAVTPAPSLPDPASSAPSDLGAAPTPSDGAIAPSPAPRLSLSDSDAGLVTPVTNFNFARLRDLWVEVDVGQLPATATVELTFVAPDGSVFRKTHASFTTLPTAVPTRELLVARPTSSGWALVMPVAVGGTSFMRLPLPGKWQLTAHVIGGTTPDLTTTFDAVVQR